VLFTTYPLIAKANFIIFALLDILTGITKLFKSTIMAMNGGLVRLVPVPVKKHQSSLFAQDGSKVGAVRKFVTVGV
jgi:hypothetical protein